LKTSTRPFGSWDQLTIDQNRFPFPVLGERVLWFGEDLGLPTQVRLDPIAQGSRVSLVSEQAADPRKMPGLVPKQQECAFAITDIGRQHEDCEQKALGIHQKHPFATPDFFSRHRSRVLGLARDWSSWIGYR